MYAMNIDLSHAPPQAPYSPCPSPSLLTNISLSFMSICLFHDPLRLTSALAQGPSSKHTTFVIYCSYVQHPYI